MKIAKWLIEGDPAIKTLVQKTLLDITIHSTASGLIKRYLDLYDTTKKQWGEGVYSPKWYSTHYTLLELRKLLIDPREPIYQEAVRRLMELMWYNKGKVAKTRYQDTCIVGMMLNMLAYGNVNDYRIEEMIDHLLEHQFPDGGWNCAWERKPYPSHSSIHTTLSVIEGLWEYEKNGYRHRLSEVRNARTNGEEYLLRKKLYLRETTNTPIINGITVCHYPQRWKYDIYKALEYFADSKHPFDLRMQPALEIVCQKIQKGIMPAGPTYPGKIHFSISTADKQRLTTYTALKIIKEYKPEQYLQYLETEI